MDSTILLSIVQLIANVISSSFASIDTIVIIDTPQITILDLMCIFMFYEELEWLIEGMRQ